MGVNLTTIKNKVKSLVQDGYSIIAGDKSQSYTMAGYPIGFFYGYKVDGVYQSQADIDASPKNTLATVTPGDLKFADVNGDGEITPADRTLIGDPTPDVTYGKFTYIQKEKAFFAAAFRYDKQNSLREHDFDLILAFYENLIHEKSGSPVSPEMHFLLEMYCQGSITMTVKWVLTGMDLTPSEFAALLVRAMPEDLKKLFRNLQLLS